MGPCAWGQWQGLFAYDSCMRPMACGLMCGADCTERLAWVKFTESVCIGRFAWSRTQWGAAVAHVLLKPAPIGKNSRCTGKCAFGASSGSSRGVFATTHPDWGGEGCAEASRTARGLRGGVGATVCRAFPATSAVPCSIRSGCAPHPSPTLHQSPTSPPRRSLASHSP
eukprot:365732-Chlamydomonas_euryale.AAC.9